MTSRYLPITIDRMVTRKSDLPGCSAPATRSMSGTHAVTRFTGSAGLGNGPWYGQRAVGAHRSSASAEKGASTPVGTPIPGRPFPYFTSPGRVSPSTVGAIL